MISKLDKDHKHSPEAIRARLAEERKVSYLREWVYGGIDGVVTTFAIVAAVTGASLAPIIVVILGIANLVGDGFSMAAGAYSSTKAEIDNYERLRELERRHIEKYPEGEKEEVRQIYQAKGFSGPVLEDVVATITADKKAWIDTMMSGEYGLSPETKTPLKAGFHTFIAFVICGAMPLVPFLLGLPYMFETALILSALTFFAIGSFKSLWAVSSWWRYGFETMAIGLGAAGIAFAIGYALRPLGL